MSANIWDPGTGTMLVDAESTNLEQVFTTTLNQTLLTLTAFSYTPNTGSIAVYRNGQRLIKDVDYTETSETEVTLLIAVAAGEKIVVVGIIGSASESSTHAAESAAAAAVSAAEASAAASNLPNATTAGADKFIKSDATGDAWEYLTAAETLAEIGAEPADVSILKSADIGTTVQAQLVSGTTIKTVNGEDLLGSGNIVVGGLSAGLVAHFAMKDAPTGWMKAYGAAVSVTTYADLDAAIYVGDAANATAPWGYRCTNPANPTGSRSTTGGYIVTPDLRAEFIRGWDDGRGVDSGRAFGSAQSGDIQSHNHVERAYTSGGGVSNGVYIQNGTVPADLAISTAATGGIETRPRNVALLACIKF